MDRVLFSILVCLCVTHLVIGNVVIPKCSYDEACEFDLELEYRFTNTWYDGNTTSDAYLFWPLVATEGGIHRLRECDGQIINETLPESELDNVATADGAYKLAMMVNKKIPGPPIVVYQDQEVIVNVKNKLDNEATTIHFHGLHQEGTPYMDGGGGVSQCNINPYETFTYRFKPSLAGTYWYHSHVGTQLSMGINGPFIVLPKPDEVATEERTFQAEFYMMVADWFLESSHSVFHRFFTGGSAIEFGMPDLYDCLSILRTPDGVISSTIPFHSGLINGKGWIYNKTTDEPINTNVPLEVFRVTKGKRYRFRLISAAMSFQFRISIDGHKLYLIAADSHGVDTLEMDSIIMHSGERYDVYIDADDPYDTGNYWIRAEAIDFDKELDPGVQVVGEHMEAILRYDGAPKILPETSERECTPDQKCIVFNCPFLNYPPWYNMQCLHLTDLRSIQHLATYPADTDQFQETFLNFHFSLIENGELGYKPTIGGKQNIFPTTPPMTDPLGYEASAVPCDEELCAVDHCMCSNILKYPIGAIVQMTFINTQKHIDPTQHLMSHPIHIHGHHFQVLKIGWPDYYENGTYKGETEDVECVGSNTCGIAKWTNESWYNGNVPGLIETGAPWKDTVLAPLGGYLVLRVKMDNPGFWLMHCHVETHQAGGMALIIQEGEAHQIPPPPKNFPTCGDFLYIETEDPKESECGTDDNDIEIMAIVLLIIMNLTLFGLVVYLLYRSPTRTGYTYIGGDDEK